MPHINPVDGPNWPDVRITRVEQILVQKAIGERSQSQRDWLADAICHYERWQDMWAGPLPTDDEVSSEVELFATLVENAPGFLRGHWRLLHELVRLNAALWVSPRESLDAFEMGIEPTMPYLDRKALTAAWPRLRAVANGFAPHEERPKASAAR